jgi:addiction module RelE/StbE family toxin
MRLAWTAAALRDLASARGYIAQDNAAAADDQVGRVFGAVTRLVRFSEIGRPGRFSGTRELVVARTPYIVAYRLRGETIEILRVLHARQRWPERLD